MMNTIVDRWEPLDVKVIVILQKNDNSLKMESLNNGVLKFTIPENLDKEDPKRDIHESNIHEIHIKRQDFLSKLGA